MSAAHERHSFRTCDVIVVETDPPYYENCYVIRHRDSDAVVIVDPGAGAAPILEAATAEGGRVSHILLTHAHPDHIASLYEIQTATNAPVIVHRDEKSILDAAGPWGQALLGRGIAVPEAALVFFSNEERLEEVLDGTTPIATPGHTPGGVCFLFDGFALTGDTLFMQGVGRTDFPGGNGPQLAASITRFLEQVPGDTLLFSGHGPAWTADEARRWWKDMAF